MQEASPHTAPNPFAERSETTALETQHHATDAGERIITNLLDEQQELILHREDRALRRTHTQTVIQNRSGYVFSTPDVEQRLLMKYLVSCSLLLRPAPLRFSLFPFSLQI